MSGLKSGILLYSEKETGGGGGGGVRVGGGGGRVGALIGGTEERHCKYNCNNQHMRTARGAG